MSNKSPRKAGKGLKKKETKHNKQRLESVRVAFEEDNNEVIVEVEGGAESIFPIEGDSSSANNNAVSEEMDNMAQNNTQINRDKPSRADQFQNMVSSASAALDMDGVEQLDKSMTSNHSGTPTSNNHSLSYQRERLNLAIRMMKICLWHYRLKFCPKPGNRCKRKKMNLRRRESIS